MRRLSVAHFSILAVLAAGACGGSSSASKDSGASAGTACGDSAFFTACVQQCGETSQSEPTSAGCVAGLFQCESPLKPATDCPAGSWTSSRLPCGPWPAGYDCGLGGCALCDSARGWTCASCPDAAR